MLKIKLAQLKLGYMMRDWGEIKQVLVWLEEEGYLEAPLWSAPVDQEELKRRLERTREGGKMWLPGLKMAYIKRDWGEVKRVVDWLETKGYIQ